jgi:hypothetical protein
MMQIKNGFKKIKTPTPFIPLQGGEFVLIFSIWLLTKQNGIFTYAI